MSKCWGLIIWYCLGLQLIHFQVQAQENAALSDTISIQIQPIINNQILVLGQNYFLPNLNDSLAINRLRFYISNISFTQSSNPSVKTEQQFHLIDCEKPSSLIREVSLFAKFQFDSIHFQIGVDSTTQVKGVQGGDLDPMHGMYWSWRSGYINFKCEGSSSICPGRNKEFLFHIGGYQAPFNTIQFVSLPIYSDTIVIQVDLTNLFTPIAITENYKIMSPNVKAMKFANQLPTLFKSIP